MDGGAVKKNTAALERIMKEGFSKADATKILKKLIAKKRKAKKVTSTKKRSKKRTTRKAKADNSAHEDPMRALLQNQIESATAQRNVQQANDLARAMSESKVAKEAAEQKHKELAAAAKLSDDLKREAVEKKREADDAKREAAEKKREADDAKRETADAKREAEDYMIKSVNSRIASKKLKKGVTKLTNKVADIEFVRSAGKHKIKSEWEDWILEQQSEGNIPWKGRTDITGEDMTVSDLKKFPYQKILDVSKKLRIDDIRDIYKKIHQETAAQFVKKKKPEEVKHDSKMPGEAGYVPTNLDMFHDDDDDGNVPPPPPEEQPDQPDDEHLGLGEKTGRRAASLMFKSIFGSGRPDILSNFQLDFLMQKHPEYRGTISRDEIHKLSLPANSRSCWIMNTDPSNMPGKHWVAVYLDPVKELTAEYYNSSGEPCPDDIFQDIQKAVDGLKLPMKLRFKDNRIQNQDDSDNCGWFCMYFLKQRLAGKTWKFCTGYTDLTENLIENWKNNLKIPEKFRDI